MAQINRKITIRSVYFGMLLLSAAVMILTVRLTIASDLNSLNAAAEQGDAEAQLNLGVMYDNSEGIPEIYTAAARWYHMAAEQGNAKAQVKLGYMYDNGEGVPKDYVQAYAWVNIGAAQIGDEESGSYLEVVAEEMTASAITKAQSLSREYWEVYGPNRASSE